MARTPSCVTDSSGLSSQGLNGLRKGAEHPAYAPSVYGPTQGLNGLRKGAEHPAYAPSVYGPPLHLPLVMMASLFGCWSVTPLLQPDFSYGS